MTQTQLQYWQQREQQRNNVEVNAETQRANLAREAENAKHNRAIEDIERAKLANNISITTLDRAERAREADQTLTEQSRANRERERQNSTALGISAGQLQAQLDRNANDLRTNLMSVTEQSRHNTAVEGETAAHNRAVESEQFRTDKANEILSAQRNQITDEQNIRTSNAQLLQAVTGAGNLGANNTRNQITAQSNEANVAVTRRGQTLNTLGNLLRLGSDFYETNVNLLRGRKGHLQ